MQSRGPGELPGDHAELVRPGKVAGAERLGQNVDFLAGFQCFQAEVLQQQRHE